MMEGWKQVKIGDFCNVLSSKRIFAKDYVQSGIPFYRSKEIIHKALNQFEGNELYITEERFRAIKNKFGAPKKGELLISSVGNRSGIPYLVKENYEFYFKDGNLIWFKDFSGNLLSQYLEYFLRSELGQALIDNMMIGAAQKALTIDGVKKIKILLPPLPIQRKIAAILSAYDDLIENNLKRIKLLEEKAQLTYEEWFVRMRFPGHETTKFDEATGLPEGWEKMKLNLMTDYIGRGISPNYVDSDGISIVNQKCIRNNRVNRDLIRLSHKEKNISQEKRLQSLDILVNSTGTGTLGRVAQIFSVKEKMSVDTHVTIVRGNSKDSKIFLGRTIEYNQPRIENVGKGSTNQIELSRKDLGNIEVNSPIKSLRVKFDKMFMPNYEAIEKLTQSNKLLKEARDILLPRLMTGMIDVS